MTPEAIGGRLQQALWLRGEALMMSHTNPWELDEALTNWGYVMGPCEAQDLIGLDRVLARQPERAVAILPRMVAEGRMGKSGGVGFYRYPGGGGAVIDPLIEDLILEEAWFARVTRTELDDAALVAQMNAALIAEVAALFEEGVAESVVLRALAENVHFPADRSL